MRSSRYGYLIGPALPLHMLARSVITVVIVDYLYKYAVLCKSMNTEYAKGLCRTTSFDVSQTENSVPTDIMQKQSEN